MNFDGSASTAAPGFSIINYIWDFDDGSFSTEENPTHVFYVRGTYMVKLTVYGLSGEAEFSQPVTVYETDNSGLTYYGPKHRG